MTRKWYPILRFRSRQTPSVIQHGKWDPAIASAAAHHIAGIVQGDGFGIFLGSLDPAHELIVAGKHGHVAVIPAGCCGHGPVKARDIHQHGRLINELGHARSTVKTPSEMLSRMASVGVSRPEKEAIFLRGDINKEVIDETRKEKKKDFGGSG